MREQPAGRLARTPVTKVLLGLGLLLVVAVSLVAGAVIYATWFDTEATESSVGLRTHVAGDPLHYHGLYPRPGPPSYGPPGYGPPRRPPLPDGGGLRPPNMTEEDVKALVVTHVLMRGAASLESCIHGNFPWEDSARYIGAGTWIVDLVHVPSR